MLGDAEATGEGAGFREVDVPGVGVVWARRPGPDAIPHLAVAGDASVSAEQRSEALHRFVRMLLRDGEFDGLLLRMAEGGAPADTVHRVAEALATWGTARPYVTVVTLALSCAHSWREVRRRLVECGVDPMGLRSMHWLLDVVERMLLDGLPVTGDADKDRAEREKLLTTLYPPQPARRRSAAAGQAGGRVEPPSWWRPEATGSLFAAAMAAR